MTPPYKLVGEDEEGELWIGGIGLAKGYLHAPDMTKDVVNKIQYKIFLNNLQIFKKYLFQKFLPNPFGQGFVYRSGDIVTKIKVFYTNFIYKFNDKINLNMFNIYTVQNESNNYVFIRRIDDQVKINGFRIELGEIENVFAQHNLVDQAVAIVSNNNLVIFLKPASSNCKLTENDLEVIRKSISRILPHYMIPK
jgi:bacitracin synthase 3